MRKRHRFTLVSFILGIVSLVMSLFIAINLAFIAFTSFVLGSLVFAPLITITPASIVAIVMGVIAIRRSKKEELPGKGLAVTGVACGSLGAVFMFFALWIALSFSAMSTSLENATMNTQ